MPAFIHHLDEILQIFRSENPCACKNVSALLLLVLRVFADNHDAALALDDLALFAHGLYGRSHSHDVASLLQSGSALAAPGDAAAG